MSIIRNLFRWMAALAAAVLTLASCIGEEERDTYPEAGIMTFGVSSITSDAPDKKYDSEGNATDTIVRKTIGGSSILFNIDQIGGHIFTTDSLPYWVDLTSVAVNFTAHGEAFVKDVDGALYAIQSGSRLDFTRTVRLVCVSSDGTTTKEYTVDILRHKGNHETLQWSECATNLVLTGESRAFVWGSHVWLFARNERGEDVMTAAATTDPTMGWSEPRVVPVECGSVVLFGDSFYGLAVDGTLYVCRAGGDQWEPANTGLVRLLGSDGLRLYAVTLGATAGEDGDEYMCVVGTTDGRTWEPQAADSPDWLPDSHVQMFGYPSRTNTQFGAAVMVGQTDGAAVVWCKQTSANSDLDTPWRHIQATGDNPYVLPLLDNLSVTLYKRSLYALGVRDGKFEPLLRSDDSGIAWHPQKEAMPVPANLDPANGAATLVAVGDEFWIIQPASGMLWRANAKMVAD